MKTSHYMLLGLLLMPSGLKAEDIPPMAQIITQNELPARCISPIAVHTINGERKMVSSQGFELEPGLYTLSGKARLNLTYCRPVGSSNRMSVPPLKAVFEAGKKYYVGLDHSSRYRKEWHYVIWKIENQDGEIIERIDEEPFDFEEPESLGILDG